MDYYSLVQFETNRHSVPVGYVRKTVTLKALPETTVTFDFFVPLLM